MTVAVETSRKNYTGDASTTVFPYDFLIFVTGDLEVYEDGVLQTETTHYTVSGAGVAAGGNVTFVTAPASSVAITIIRVLTFTQPTDLIENDALPAATVEQAFDRSVMLTKQNDERLDRAIVLAVDSTLVDIELPSPGASQVIGWNAGGTDLALYTIGTSEILSVMTTLGDLIAGGASGAPKRLAVGAAGSIMKVTSAEPAWLAAGAAGTLLQMGATEPAWVAEEAVIRDYHDFNEQGSAPASPAANDRRLWISSGGVIQFKNSAGTIVIIDSFAAGTKMVFVQAAATGWTLETAYTGRVLRFDHLDGDGTGGSADIDGGMVTSAAASAGQSNRQVGSDIVGEAHVHRVTYNISHRNVICCSKD